MPDPTLSEALEEAYASAPSDRALIDTVSIWYDGMLVDGVPGEIRCYRGWTGDRENADGVPLKDFRLEAGSRYDADNVVEFIAIPFDVTLPNVASQAMVKGQLVIDGVGREIADALLDAVSLGASIEVTYRAYLEGLELDGPQNDPPLSFGLSNVSLDMTTVRGDITVGSVGNKRFPGDLYRASRFPAIR